MAMNSIVEFLQHPNFAKTLVDSLHCGFLVVDDECLIHSTNSLTESILGVSNKKIIGKMVGKALGCIKASGARGDCDFAGYCSGCDVAKLCSAAIKSNQVQKTRTSLQLVIHGQLRNDDFLVSAIPIAFNERRFSILFLQDIPLRPSPTLSDSRKEGRKFVGEHPKMKKLFQVIRRVAQTNITVLIEGETGTGKELVAKAIHKESSRARNHFVPINCGALPEGLLETELFGHVKGAFTGAIRDKKGRFELANGGTLFYDEVGDLSPTMQVQLLRFLEDGKFQPVGSERTLQADVRIISATNKKLEKEVALGRFRKDLYYRLNAMPVHLPPLRERRSDIPLLAEHFLALYGKEFFRKKARLSSEAESIFVAYDWPGNVRELQNAIQYSLAKCFGNLIEPSHLMPHLLHAIRFGVNQTISVEHRRPTLRMEDVIQALKKTDGNKSEAAVVLGVSRSTLYRFLAKQEEDQIA